VAIFDGFSILGAIGELQGEPLVWLAVESARCVRLLGSIGAIDKGGGGECNVLGLWVCYLGEGGPSIDNQAFSGVVRYTHATNK
jgi:hypothetical protein